jgi:hypothetical protein
VPDDSKLSATRTVDKVDGLNVKAGVVDPDPAKFRLVRIVVGRPLRMIKKFISFEIFAGASNKSTRSLYVCRHENQKDNQPSGTCSGSFARITASETPRGMAANADLRSYNVDAKFSTDRGMSLSSMMFLAIEYRRALGSKFATIDGNLVVIAEFVLANTCDRKVTILALVNIAQPPTVPKSSERKISSQAE